MAHYKLAFEWRKDGGKPILEGHGPRGRHGTLQWKEVGRKPGWVPLLNGKPLPTPTYPDGRRWQMSNADDLRETQRQAVYFLWVKHLQEHKLESRDLDLETWKKKNTITMEVVVNKTQRTALDKALAARRELEKAQEKAQKATVRAVRALVKHEKLSYRDIGDLLGVSKPRVHQLAASE